MFISSFFLETLTGVLSRLGPLISPEHFYPTEGSATTLPRILTASESDFGLGVKVVDSPEVAFNSWVLPHLENPVVTSDNADWFIAAAQLATMAGKWDIRLPIVTTAGSILPEGCVALMPSENTLERELTEYCAGEICEDLPNVSSRYFEVEGWRKLLSNAGIVYIETHLRFFL